MKKDVIRIGKWSIHLNLDLLATEDRHMKFSEFKEQAIKDHPDIVEKYRLKSSLGPGAKITKNVAWDSVVEELAEKELI